VDPLRLAVQAIHRKNCELQQAVETHARQLQMGQEPGGLLAAGTPRDDRESGNSNSSNNSNSDNKSKKKDEKQRGADQSFTMLLSGVSFSILFWSCPNTPQSQYSFALVHVLHYYYVYHDP